MTNKASWEHMGHIKAWYSIIGTMGGKSTSEAKRKAGRANVKKAFAIRMAKLGKVVENV